MGNSPSALWPTVAPQWMLNLPESLENIFYRMYKCFIYQDRYMMYVEGLANTLILTAMALLMGIVIGVVVALIRSSWDKNGEEMKGISKAIMRILNGICQAASEGQLTFVSITNRNAVDEQHHHQKQRYYTFFKFH